MKPIRIVVLVLAVACAFPAGASALELEVNTLNDPGDGGCFYPEEECTLRGAIYAADASEEPDTISFEVEGTIKPGFPLPELEGSITLDATTAPGWEGSPVVYLDGSEAEFEGGTWGMRVRENSSANIYGLGIGEFDLGIWFEPGSAGRACGNFVGTDLTGTQARPNYDGIWVDEGARFVQVGRQCGEIGGNLVSGNTEWGIVAAGEELEIDKNLVGTDAVGRSSAPQRPRPRRSRGSRRGYPGRAQCDRSDRRRARRPGTAPQRDRLQPRPRRPRPERGPVRDRPPELDLRQ